MNYSGRCFCLWATFALAPLAAEPFPEGPPEFRVLLVGDSWADFFWQNASLRDVFAAHGFPEILEKGDVTAISGSTAAQWAQADHLQLITDELAANPTIEVVQVSIGGNDFLAGQPGGGWFTGMTPQAVETLFTTIAANTQTVIDHILALRPDLEILISLYDYPNFVESLNGPLFFFCNGRWNDMGQPTPLQLNQIQTEFLDRIQIMVTPQPRVFLVRHLGLMQFHFGFPGLEILPGDLPPPGDLNLPSPQEAMFLNADCFHLNPAGYAILAENLWNGYYIDVFSCLTEGQFGERLTDWPQTRAVTDLIESLDRLCP